jgi:hypothetical protein
MNNRPLGGRSSETLSHPIDMIIMAIGMKEDVETESLDVKVCRGGSRNNMPLVHKF